MMRSARLAVRQILVSVMCLSMVWSSASSYHVPIVCQALSSFRVPSRVFESRLLCRTPSCLSPRGPGLLQWGLLVLCQMLLLS